MFSFIASPLQKVYLAYPRHTVIIEKFFIGLSHCLLRINPKGLQNMPKHFLLVNEKKAKYQPLPKMLPLDNASNHILQTSYRKLGNSENVTPKTSQPTCFVLVFFQYKA